MNRFLVLFVVILTSACIGGLSAAWADVSNPADPAPKLLCTDAWYQSVEKQLPTGDAQKHGPDIGSDEWKSVVEQKLKVRGKAEVPDRGDEGWCRYIDQLMHGGETAMGAASPGPSYDCDKVTENSIETTICNDKELSELDRKLAAVYADAQISAKDRRATLEAEQRGWVKGRNDCWKNDDKSACVRDAYFRRIAELQAVYQLVQGIGPAFYKCDGKPGGEVVVTFFETDPRTLVAERGGDSSLMYVVPSGSGARYQGRNETFWEHQGEATIVWGPGAQEMHCKKAQ